MPLLRSATLLASSWPCNRCSHLNDSSRNKKCCSSCRAWRDGLAPLSAKGGGTSMSGAAASLSDAVDKRRCLCSFLLPWNNIWFHHFRPPPNDKPQCIHTRSLSEGRYDDLIELLFFFSHLKASSNNSSGEAKRANRERWTS